MYPTARALKRADISIRGSQQTGRGRRRGCCSSNSIRDIPGPAVHAIRCDIRPQCRTYLRAVRCFAHPVRSPKHSPGGSAMVKSVRVSERW